MRALDEMREARRALDAGNIPLARRYLDNALSRFLCVICRELLGDRPVEQFYENQVHLDCLSTYGGRGEYVRQHPEAARIPKPIIATPHDEWFTRVTRAVSGACKDCQAAHGELLPSSIGKRVAAALWAQLQPGEHLRHVLKDLFELENADPGTEPHG